jgi:hypothetical protein
MFKWIKKYLLLDEELKAGIALQEAKERLENQRREELVERGGELTKILIEAGIHPIKRKNGSLTKEFVSQYGIINGRLVMATMNRQGALVMEYVGEGKTL